MGQRRGRRLPARREWLAGEAPGSGKGEPLAEAEKQKPSRRVGSCERGEREAVERNYGGGSGAAEVSHAGERLAEVAGPGSGSQNRGAGGAEQGPHPGPAGGGGHHGPLLQRGHREGRPPVKY